MPNSACHGLPFQAVGFGKAELVACRLDGKECPAWQLLSQKLPFRPKEMHRKFSAHLLSDLMPAPACLHFGGRFCKKQPCLSLLSAVRDRSRQGLRFLQSAEMSQLLVHANPSPKYCSGPRKPRPWLNPMHVSFNLIHHLP